MSRITEDFVSDEIPPLPCPACRDPLVARKDGLQFDLSKESAFHCDWVDNDPTMACGVFTLRLGCSRSSCNESVICVGSFLTTEHEYPSGEPAYFRRLSPQFFHPTIQLFALPSGFPDKIRNPLLDSFAIFWANPSAAGNSLRISVEALMDYRCIKKWTTGKKGKKVEIKLHDRILDFQKTTPDVGEKLLAVKWLGNSGSHLMGLEKKDVINGYALYSYVLDELFESRTEALGKLAKKIIRKKGPG